MIALVIVGSRYLNPHLQHHIRQQIVSKLCPSIRPDEVWTAKDSYPPGVNAGAHSLCTFVRDRHPHNETTEMVKYSKDVFIFIVR